MYSRDTAQPCPFHRFRLCELWWLVSPFRVVWVVVVGLGGGPARTPVPTITHSPISLCRLVADTKPLHRKRSPFSSRNGHPFVPSGHFP